MRQQRWMDERSAEKDRSEAVAELSGRMDAAPLPAQVLERVTQKIAERLQVEVRQEMAKSAAAPGGEVHAALESHLENHACSICYEVMCAPRRPTLLSPCGHTFSVCLEKVLPPGASCPRCTRVASSAVNFNLQTIIDNFVATRQALARGDAPPRDAARPAVSAPGPSTTPSSTGSCRALPRAETQRDEASAEGAAAARRGRRRIACSRERKTRRVRVSTSGGAGGRAVAEVWGGGGADLSALSSSISSNTLAPLQVEREKAGSARNW